MINFLKTPFPDNHDGFDYNPKTFTDVQREMDEETQMKKNLQSQNKLMSMFASIFK